MVFKQIISRVPGKSRISGQIGQKRDLFSGISENYQSPTRVLHNVVPKYLGNLGMKLGFAQKSYLPASLNFANSIHTVGPKEFERGDNNGRGDRENNSGYFGGVTNGPVERENNSGYFGGANNGPVFRENYARSFEGPHQRLADINRGQLPIQPEFFQNLTRKFADMGKSRDLSETGQDSRPYVQGFDQSQSGLSGRNMNFSGGFMRENENYRSGVEQNADIVHVKIMRNNTFVTVTDSKGNKKMGSSAGSLAEMKGGPKVSNIPLKQLVNMWDERLNVWG
ncbi:uncharacterized protein LOC143635226 [Bidens hawaiensis]|uniref:uncharacterized protein LOC143635226 n=1 Tax=Bidens hawaiensis TaxID=980011 RepID=UPI0040497E19